MNERYPPPTDASSYLLMNPLFAAMMKQMSSQNQRQEPPAQPPVTSPNDNLYDWSGAFARWLNY